MNGADRHNEVPEVTVVLPAHDEARSLPPVLAELESSLDAAGVRAEILVVDDGSRDGTRALLEQWSPGGRVRSLHHAVNLGYGAALRTGFAASRGEWVAFLDADGQMVPADLPRLLTAARVGGVDAVLGFRSPRRDPLPRRLNASLWRLAVGTLLGVWATDVDCALKVIRGDLLRALPLACRGAAINAELLLHLRRRGATVREMPVAHRPRAHGRASGARPAVIAQAIRDLARLAAGKGRMEGEGMEGHVGGREREAADGGREALGRRRGSGEKNIPATADSSRR